MWNLLAQSQRQPQLKHILNIKFMSYFSIEKPSEIEYFVKYLRLI